MNRWSILAVSLVMSLSLNAQMENLRPQTESYLKALVKKDYAKIANQTYPAIIKMGGGIDYVLQDLKAERESIENQQIYYQSAKVGEIGKVWKVEKELQTIIPVYIDIQFKGKDYISNTHLLAISDNNGKTWSFVNLEKFDQQSIKEFLPKLHPELVIPLMLPYQKKEK